MLYFVRHGESEANLRGVAAGSRDNSLLTDKGRRQAEEAAEEIKSAGIIIDKILFSPLERTRETAEIIGRALNLKSSKITPEERILEHDKGSMTGKPLSEVTTAGLMAAKDAESPTVLHDRVLSCLQEFSASPENILLVSHGGVFRMIETIRQKRDPQLFYDLKCPPNAMVSKIDWL